MDTQARDWLGFILLLSMTGLGLILIARIS